ncbi:MAG: type II secretion system protein GspL [Sedimenticola sp.]
MSELMLVRAGTEQDDHYTWLSVDKKGNPAAQASTGTLDQLAVEVKRKRLMLLVPGSDVLLTCVEMPGSKRVPASAINFALEEQLADDVDSLYITSGIRLGGGEIPVAAISKARLNTWLERLKEANLQAAACLPEALLLPWQPGNWSLMEEGGQVTLRAGQYQGMGIETETLEPILTKLLGERTGEPPPTVRLWSDQIESQLPELLQRLGCPVDPVTLSGKGITLFTPEACKRSPLELLQSVRQNESNDSVGGWLAVAAMLLLALAVHIAGNGYHYWQLKKGLVATNVEIHQQFKKSFPDINRVVDPLVQAEQALDKRRQDSGRGRDPMLGLLHQTGSALKEDKTLVLTGLEFRQGVMQMRLQGKGVGSVERFKQRLEKNGGVEAEVTSANTNKSGVEARMKIKAGRS